MRRLLKKIYNTIVPVSWREFNQFAEAMADSLDGMTVAAEQQAEMLASLVNQVSGLQMVKAEKQTEEEKKVEYDEAFQ